MTPHEIWNKSVPMSCAYEHILSKELFADYVKLCEAANKTSIMQDMVEALGNNDPNSYITKRSDPNHPLNLKIAHVKKMDQILLHHLQQGNILAHGFSIPRRAEDQAQAVPVDLWKACKTFELKDELKGSGLHMTEIRLMPAAWLEKLAPQEPEKKPAGRPSRSHYITEATQQLLNEGAFDLSKPNKDHHPAILARIHRNHPETIDDETGLGPKSLEKHANPILNSLK